MVQEVTTTSWGKRIINAFWGMLIGIALIIGAIYLIFWNEGNSLHTAQSLAQTEKVIISIPNAPIDAKNDMHVVYLTGPANTNNVLTDKLFNISEKAIQLNRQVEMYQWEENKETTTEKEMGGSEKEITNYTYEQVWSTKEIASADFKEQTGHQNPVSMPIRSKIQYAKDVTVGDFKLPFDLVQQITGNTNVDLSKADTAALQTKFHKPVKMQGDQLYVGNDADLPKIGDLRIGITEVLPQTVSIISQQSGNILQPYMAPAGESVSLIEMGQISPQEMIHNAEVQNRVMMWILRLVSLVMMIIGFAMLMSPLSVLADVIPFLGSIVSIGTGLIAFVAGFGLWIVCLAIAWFVVRPLLSVIMITVVILLFGWLYIRKRK